MADLIAQGASPADRWRRTLTAGQTAMLGRGLGVFAADWDDCVSRRHAELQESDGTLEVRRLPSARNPIYLCGAAVDHFRIRPGEHFVIGKTTFTFVDQRVEVSLQARQPAQQRTFSPQYLRQVVFRNAQERVEVLGRLPEVISGAASEAELFIRVINLLMTGIPRADAVALVRATAENSDPIEVLHSDQRRLSGGSFQPSEGLIRDAVRRVESVLHLWDPQSQSTFTEQENVDWAFCTPVLGEACQGWAFYVAGRQVDVGGSPSGSEASDFRDDLKFTEVAAATLRSLRELRILQRHQAGLSQFFSPLVLDAIAADDPEIALAPRETEVTVLFCDLRGFSRESEKAADDLLGLLDRVSRALGVTTHQILGQGGVVGDFQGDAVMGFWGWPMVQPDAIGRACAAALQIRAELTAERRQDDPLAGFRLGIGIATGNAVAGKIGTVDQVKVTVFGPVVNLASRLEGLTGRLHAPILLDAPTARYVRTQLEDSTARCRRLAVVQPYGLTTPVEVHELLPSEAEFPQLSAVHLRDYETAVEAFLRGDWDEALRGLHKVPAEDRAKDFLTVLIAGHNRTAPDDWDGVIRMDRK